MPEVSVLVASCDKYSDLWRPFFQIFKRRWPDCPYPVYLGSNYKVFRDDHVRCIPIGPDRSWSENLLSMLDAMNSSHVILFLEDFFILRPVDTPRLGALVNLAVENGVGCLRLIPHPGPTRKVGARLGIGELRHGDEWRVSTQVAIWDAEVLRFLSWPGFTAWDFEQIGSLVSNAMPDSFWGVYEAAIHYRHGVWRGKWLPTGLSICRELGVEPDLEARGVLDESELASNGEPPGDQHTSRYKRQLAPYYSRYLRLIRPRYYVKRMLSQSAANSTENMRRLRELRFGLHLR